MKRKSMRKIHKQNNVPRLDDRDCPKGWEVNEFALTDALRVHVENLIAYYGEEAVRRQLAISSKKTEQKVA